MVHKCSDVNFFSSAVWWQQHGINCLELQRLAVRILSQTCSSFGCEHNWSVYDQIYNGRQNRLAQKKLNDFMFAHYNLRLRERQIRQSNELMSLDSALQEGLLDDWIVEAGIQAPQDDEVSLTPAIDSIGDTTPSPLCVHDFYVIRWDCLKIFR